MSVTSNLAASWSAFKAAGMLTAATWTDSDTGTSADADVMLDAPGVVTDDGVVLTAWSIVYVVSTWPAVRPNDRIDIGAAAYAVTDSVPIGDGLLARAALRRLD